MHAHKSVNYDVPIYKLLNTKLMDRQRQILYEERNEKRANKVLRSGTPTKATI